jgi:hypothetical protein
MVMAVASLSERRIIARDAGVRIHEIRRAGDAR